MTVSVSDVQDISAYPSHPFTFMADKEKKKTVMQDITPPAAPVAADYSQTQTNVATPETVVTTASTSEEPVVVKTDNTEEFLPESLLQSVTEKVEAIAAFKDEQYEKLRRGALLPGGVIAKMREQNEEFKAFLAETLVKLIREAQSK